MPANWAEANSTICHSHSLFLSVGIGNIRFQWIYESALEGKRANEIFALECLSHVWNERTNSYRFLWRYSWRRTFWCRILTDICDMSVGRWFTFKRSGGFIIQRLHIEFGIFLTKIRINSLIHFVENFQIHATFSSFASIVNSTRPLQYDIQCYRAM